MPELNTSVRYLKGVGPKRQSYLNNLGIETIEDLIHETPRGWEERRFLNNLALAAGPKRRAFFGEIVSAVESMSPRQDFCFFKAVIRTNNNFAPRLVLTWIRRRSRFDIFAKLRREIAGGRKIFVFGRLELDQIFKNSEIALIVEDYEIAAGLPAAGPSAHWGRLAPVYPATKGLEQKMLRSFRWEAMRVWKTLGRPAPWPEAWKQKLPQGAMDLKRAYEIIHFPANEKELEHARVALAFWDIFLLTTAMEIRRRQILQIRKPHCYIKEGTREQGNEGIRGESVIGRYDYPPLFTKLLEKLDIKLTASQDLAVQEILKDMDKPFPMNRLLQGEVGSGKTLVAVGALCRAAGAGYQTAFIAPTEILAFQHFMNFRRMLEPLGLTIGCLTGDTPAKERTGLLENLQNGSLKLIVGTHTLLEPQVRFHNLALTIIDEQHRFGVDQRWKMRRKAARPDTLIMTATPIPRTLALALYGELDISTMEELPMGRAIAPAVLCESENKAWDLLNCRLQKGLQAYIVVPAIEDKDDPGYNLEKEYSRLKEKFSGISIKIMHGRMPAHEKEAVLMDFNCGKTAILLSTTVIEVGIDVPQAGIIVILGAERFGLATLHQLRGRVSRGAETGLCVLVPSQLQSGKSGGHAFNDRLFDQTDNETSGLERLRQFCLCKDGFEIGELDLKKRGPGDLIGFDQHGLAQFKHFDWNKDIRLIASAKALSKDVCDGDFRLEKNHFLKQAIAERFGGDFLQSDIS